MNHQLVEVIANPLIRCGAVRLNITRNPEARQSLRIQGRFRYRLRKKKENTHQKALKSVNHPSHRPTLSPRTLIDGVPRDISLELACALCEMCPSACCQVTVGCNISPSRIGGFSHTTKRQALWLTSSRVSKSRTALT